MLERRRLIHTAHLHLRQSRLAIIHISFRYRYLHSSIERTADTRLYT